MATALPTTPDSQGQRKLALMARRLYKLRIIYALIAVMLLRVTVARGSELETCLKAGEQTSSQHTTYQDFVDGKAARLSLHGEWSSNKTPLFDFSIVTGLTVSRLDQLEAQCTAWKGPLSAAVYLVLQVPAGESKLSSAGEAALKNAAAKLTQLHKKLEAMGSSSCALHMMLLVETVSEDIMKWMLPINVLRNYALLGARTGLVAMVDVDLLPSVGLAMWLLEPGNMDWLKQECSQRKVFVLPAFETAPNANMTAAHAIAREAAALDKQALLSMVEAGKVWQFALKIFKEGHNCTDYPRWFATNKAYGPVGWTKDYEPWFIADRTQIPLYDSVFRGYGWNKVTQVTNVHHQGFKFMVHPTGFLVHRQHSHSKAGSIYQDSKKTYEATLKKDKAKASADKSLAATTYKFRDRVLEQLAKGSYKPVVDSGVMQCLNHLSWWNQDTSTAAAHSRDSNSTTKAAVQRRRKRRLRRRRQQLEQLEGNLPRKLIAGAGEAALGKKQQRKRAGKPST